MLVIPGSQDKATCDGMTRRELLRIGGSAMLGLSLADILRKQGEIRQRTGRHLSGLRPRLEPRLAASS